MRGGITTSSTLPRPLAPVTDIYPIFLAIAPKEELLLPTAWLETLLKAAATVILFYSPSATKRNFILSNTTRDSIKSSNNSSNTIYNNNNILNNSNCNISKLIANI